MIVWSKGLGKQSLELELDKTTVRLDKDNICVDGLIESVYWNFTITLGIDDLLSFMKVLSRPDTAAFVAREKGILGWFAGRLVKFIPMALGAKISNMFSGSKKGA